jgi:hypothetical protein
MKSGGVTANNIHVECSGCIYKANVHNRGVPLPPQLPPGGFSILNIERAETTRDTDNKDMHQRTQHLSLQGTDGIRVREKRVVLSSPPLPLLASEISLHHFNSSPPPPPGGPLLFLRRLYVHRHLPEPGQRFSSH